MKIFSIIWLACFISANAVASWTWGPNSLTVGQSYTNTMIVDYYSSIVERCQAAGISAPGIVRTFSVYAGTTNSTTVVTNSGVVYTRTNTWVCYDSVTLTNQFYPFTYTSTNGLAVTTTNTPTLTRSQIVALDEKARELADYFVQHWAGTNDNFYSYFSQTNFTGDHPENFPMCCPAAIMKHLGIGFVTNITYSDYGVISGGDSYFTREPPTTQNWTLAEIYWKTNTALFYSRNLTTFDTRYYDSAYPVLKFFPGGTNWGNDFEIFLTGVTLIKSNQSISGSITDGGSLIFVDESNTPPVALTNFWYQISGFTNNSGALNDGDTIAVVYTNKITLYGDMPFRLYAEDLNERYAFLNAMRWTCKNGYWTNSEIRAGGNSTNSVSPADEASFLSSAEAAWSASAWTSYYAFAYSYPKKMAVFHSLGHGASKFQALTEVVRADARVDMSNSMICAVGVFLGDLDMSAFSDCSTGFFHALTFSDSSIDGIHNGYAEWEDTNSLSRCSSVTLYPADASGVTNFYTLYSFLTNYTYTNFSFVYPPTNNQDMVSFSQVSEVVSPEYKNIRQSGRGWEFGGSAQPIFLFKWDVAGGFVYCTTNAP